MNFKYNKIKISALIFSVFLSGCYQKKIEALRNDVHAVYPPGKPFPESRFIQIKNAKIHYRCFLPETEKPKGKIFFMHGFGGSTFSWRDIIPTLVKEGYYVVAADIPPFGYSVAEKHFSHSGKNRSEVLWSLLDTINNTLSTEIASQKWTLAGHSMGGAIVSVMALLQASKIEKIILTDGALPTRSGNMFLALIPPVRWFLKWYLTRKVMNYEGTKKLLFSAYGCEPSKEVVTGTLAPFIKPNAVTEFFQFLSHAKDTALYDVSKIEKPVLIIWGSKDTWIPQSSGEKIHKKIFNSTFVVIEGAAHCPMETHGEETVKQILNFLKK